MSKTIQFLSFKYNYYTYTNTSKQIYMSIPGNDGKWSFQLGKIITLFLHNYSSRVLFLVFFMADVLAYRRQRGEFCWHRRNFSEDVRTLERSQRDCYWSRGLYFLLLFCKNSFIIDHLISKLDIHLHSFRRVLYAKSYVFWYLS